MKSNQSNTIKSKVFSGLIWTFFERTFSQGITLVLSVILARLLSPNEYGLIAIVMVFISIADIFITSGFGNSLIQKKNADTLDFSSVFYFSIILSLVLYLILYAIAPIISLYYEMPELTIVMRVLGLYIPIIGFNTVQQAFVSKHMMFKKFFVATLSGSILSGLIGIIFALLGGGVWALVVQRLSNAMINTIVLWRIVRWRPRLEYSFQRMKGLISYGWKLLLSSLISNISENLTNLVIAKKFTTNDLAYYTQGSTYPRQIGLNINNTISKVLFPTLTQFQDNTLKIKMVMRRAIKVSTYIMTPMLIGLAVIAEPFVNVLLTDKWIGIVVYIQIFSIYYAFIPLHTINLQAIKAIGRSDLILKLEILKRLVGLTILFITIFFFNSPIIIALGMIIQSVTSGIVNAYPNKKLLNYGYSEQIRDIFPNIFVAVVMGILINFLNVFDLSSLLLLSLQVCLGIVIYILISYLIKIDSYIYLSNIIFEKIISLRERRTK